MGVHELMEGLIADADLREQFRQNPHKVIEQHGVTLTKEQRERLKDHDWPSVSDEEMTARISSGAFRAMF